MAGVFDLKKGAFDSSEAALLHESYAIALHGLRTTHDVDRIVAQRLARSIVKVARTEPDCLKFDGSIDPVRLAQRAILRMLQLNAPAKGDGAEPDNARPRDRLPGTAQAPTPETPQATPVSASKIMQRIFDKTSFAKL